MLTLCVCSLKFKHSVCSRLINVGCTRFARGSFGEREGSLEFSLKTLDDPAAPACLLVFSSVSVCVSVCLSVCVSISIYLCAPRYICIWCTKKYTWLFVCMKMYICVCVHQNLFLRSSQFPITAQPRLGINTQPRRLTLSFQQQHGYPSFYFQRKPPLAQTTTNTATGCPSSL